MSDPILLPCPFCGGIADFGIVHGGENDMGRFIECRKCRASSLLMFPQKTDPKPLLAELWNARYTSSKDEIQEALKAAVTLFHNEEQPTIAALRDMEACAFGKVITEYTDMDRKVSGSRVLNGDNPETEFSQLG